ncbi:MAG: S-ribosylhomocysteine lyase [Intestinibacillus sp.]
MKRIASFEVNHDTLTPGMYVSRVDGDITTYDIRVVKPNDGVYLENAAMHTFEHLFATYTRNSARGDQIIYCGPMGCRTGFYFLVRDMSAQDAIALIRATMDFIAGFAGEVPGVSRPECGNYLEHDLEGARAIARGMIPVLASWTPEKLAYPD